MIPIESFPEPLIASDKLFLDEHPVMTILESTDDLKEEERCISLVMSRHLRPPPSCFLCSISFFFGDDTSSYGRAPHVLVLDGVRCGLPSTPDGRSLRAQHCRFQEMNDADVGAGS